MVHPVRFLRSIGVELLAYLDDLIFAHATPREALAAAQKMLHDLARFGWLVHPTKCTGTTVALSSFVALGTVVCLATQPETYSVHPAMVARILEQASSLVPGSSSVPVRILARLKGCITSTWVATGLSIRFRTREMDSVIASRQAPRSTGHFATSRSWAAHVSLTAPCLDEI